MQKQTEIPVFEGSYSQLVDDLISGMSDEEFDAYQRGALILAELPERSIYALLATYIEARIMFNTIPYWVN